MNTTGIINLRKDKLLVLVVDTCDVESVTAAVGAVFWRKRRGTSLWSHNWTKWLPFSAASYDSSPLLATIPTRWLKTTMKQKQDYI